MAPVPSPPTHPGSYAEAHAHALAQEAPVFVPASYYTDDRGFSLMNHFQGVLRPEGQVNYSVQHPGVIKAWHRHTKQTDFWMCVRGHLKVGFYHEGRDERWVTVLGEQRPGVVVIPPPVWHGAATVGAEPAGLLYYLTHSYNPQEPDEDRRAFDSVPGFLWATQSR